MGNFFLGFPVPRAKIAEMIEGFAPPLDHKDNHLPDGSDPLFPANGGASGKILRWTGSAFEWIAEPTGGITTRYADPNLFFYTNFDSLDGYAQATGGGGSITLDPDRVILDTSTSTTGYATLKKSITHALPATTWDKAFRFRTRIVVECDTDKLGDIYICRGSGPDNNFLGFMVQDGLLRGISEDGMGASAVALETWSEFSYHRERDLELIFTPGSKAEFYVDGSKLGELTTYLPSGTPESKSHMYLHISTGGNNKRILFYISQFQLYQAA